MNDEHRRIAKLYEKHLPEALKKHPLPTVEELSGGLPSAEEVVRHLPGVENREQFRRAFEDLVAHNKKN